MPLNYSFPVIKMVKFMLYLAYHDKKNSLKKDMRDQKIGETLEECWNKIKKLDTKLGMSPG